METGRLVEENSKIEEEKIHSSGELMAMTRQIV